LLTSEMESAVGVFIGMSSLLGSPCGVLALKYAAHRCALGRG
jgi:hypothetical protein